MGFYGNITSTNKTQFTFDKIYPSRKVMDQAVSTRWPDGSIGDGVFIGRFVLVDYGEGEYFPIFKKDDSGIYYADSAFSIVMDLSLCKKNDIFKYQAGSSEVAFYKCLGTESTIEINEETIVYANFEEIEPDYKTNYESDIDIYGAGRGYDSTVWQKVYRDGAEKYVMIAELNSVVPTFKVTADAPTMTPVVPHFDKQSNNVAYWLHVQPQWGMRVKAANDESLSDTKVNWINSTYDEKTKDIITTTTENVNGNIYYNSKGLDKAVRSFVPNIGNEVSITPTGVSGIKYQGHGEGEPQEQPDIQEISIVLPSIGNAICEAWDVVYGLPKEDDEEQKRNLDIQWDSLKGNRMVEEDSSGYRYNPKNTESLAGCINSVHDLMGMIIMGDSPENAKDADDTSIYYNQDTKVFERKHNTYEFIDINDTEGMKDILQEENKLVFYKPKSGKDLILYEKDDKYYLKDSLENYYLEKSESPDKSRNYYTLNVTSQPIEEKYLKDAWWYSDGGNYIKATEEKAIDGKTYYKLIPTEKGYVWFRNLAYFRTSRLGTEESPLTEADFTLVQKDEAYSSSYYYWYIPGQDIAKWETTTKQITDTDGSLKTLTFIEWPDGYTWQNLVQIDLTPFRNDETVKYYIRDGKNYNLVTAHPLNYEGKLEVSGYYITLQVERVNPFYQADTYYFKSDEDYLRDRTGQFDKNKQYYLVTDTKLESEFFVVGEYYEYDEDTNAFSLSEDIVPQEGKYYYEQKLPYVIEDAEGNFKPGFEWNPNIINIPESITIGIYEEKYEMQELEGFARSFNTIHGLIIEIRKLLDTGHIYTRDLNTVQGAINKLNDIIVKFDELMPNKILMVDEYGRIKNEALGDLPLGYVSANLGIEETTTLGEIIDKVVTTVEPVVTYNERINTVEEKLNGIETTVKQYVEEQIQAAIDATWEASY